MPPLIRFMLTRLAIGFALGALTGVVVWAINLSQLYPPNPERWIAQSLFVYLFASTMGVGYLATSLFLDVE
ncbi:MULTISPECIES: hypothetical protein [unclassified Rhizobium]|uniref:hypothetical protein n=1 Tax=unclassified Rhizobium TaxID=2613769 RepID=UPI001ADD3F50|nr:MULTISPECIES: hypothetical protein [unclassified Rhizobium]MBO9126935.1 hypothetical protein [Rhizobium sp. 16-488-2b]MBO9177383.1 hypothetical protein [Rhizobium sp. 16-488-2a]